MQLDMQLGKLNPRDAKMRLAREIVTQFHGRAAAQAAEDEFVQVFQKRETADGHGSGRRLPPAPTSRTSWWPTAWQRQRARRAGWCSRAA